MTTARTALGGLLAPALAPALWPGDAAAHTCDDPFSTDLIAGRTIDAGEVKVCNDDTTLTVTFDATFPWCLLETNLHVATSEPEIPQNKAGNPVPGHFAYSDEHDCVEIDGGAIPGDTVVIAAHAEVDDGERQEGAWGTRFVERGNLGDVLHLRGAGGDVRRDVQCVFVTSTTHNGNLGGLAGADAICQARAEAAGSLAAPAPTWHGCRTPRRLPARASPKLRCPTSVLTHHDRRQLGGPHGREPGRSP